MVPPPKVDRVQFFESWRSWLRQSTQKKLSSSLPVERKLFDSVKSSLGQTLRDSLLRAETRRVGILGAVRADGEEDNLRKEERENKY